MANKALSLEYNGKLCSKCGTLEIMEYCEAFTQDASAKSDLNKEAPKPEIPKKSKSKNKIHKSDEREPRSEKFLYCGKCKTICYCSKECQTADWKDHKALCEHINTNSK